jgi:Oxidoreductase-like protein, N-terminal
MCCGRGCCPCIFDYYDAAFAEWEENIRGLGLAPDDVLKSLGQEQAKRPY